MVSFSRFLITLSLVLSALATANAQASWPFTGDKQQAPTLAPMLEKVTPGVVSISVKGTVVSRQQIPDYFRYFFGPGMPREQQRERQFQGLGSGVIIDSERGYIVTNNHVVEAADEIEITLTDGRQLEAKKIGYDEESDIALLQVEPDNLTEVKVTDSDNLRVGDFVVAIGNPFGIGQTVTTGIVSALSRGSMQGYQNYIQTDAAINRGNSGGALVNYYGELIGINTAILGPNGGNVGIGFAIPSNMMRNLVDQIIEFGEVRRGLLGITGQNVDGDLAKALELGVSQGAFVQEVQPDSGAEDAGILAGDVIVKINGKKIQSFTELRARISTMGAGKEVEIGLLREGDEKTVTVTLQQRDGGNVAAATIHPALEGATLSNATDENGNRMVRVTELEERSPAAMTGLRENDEIVMVNRRTVGSVADLRSMLSDNDAVIALTIKRGNRLFYRRIQ